MSAPRPVHPASGAEDQLAPETPAVADQGVENLNIVDGESSSDGEMSTESSTTPGQETLHLQGQLSASSSLARQGRRASNSSSSQSNCVDIGFHIGSRVDVNALVHNHLEAAGEEIKIIDFILDFVAWISNSDFLRLQLPEPKVGDRSNYPAAVEDHGIKGQSVYTALFGNLDMHTFTCKICPHVVELELEDAITHQRVHFHHYPYQCPMTHIQCGQRFASQARLEEHQFATGH